MPTLSKVALAVLTLAAALPAFADEVTLNNGAVFTGVVREEYGRVMIEVESGTLTFDRSHVRSVRKAGDVLKEYEEKLKAATDATSTYDVAVWARGKGFHDRASALFRKVIAMEPDHADARKALGYERVHGVWMQGDELMTAKGFIKYNGQWLSQEVALRLRDQDLALTIERERIASNERIVNVQADVERSRIGAERERIELARHDPGNCTDSGHWHSARFSCRPAAHLFSPPPLILYPDRDCRHTMPTPIIRDRTCTPVTPPSCRRCGASCRCPSFRSQTWTFGSSGPSIVRQ